MPRQQRKALNKTAGQPDRKARVKQLPDPLDAVSVGQFMVHSKDASRRAVVKGVKYRGAVLLVKVLHGGRRRTIRCRRNERAVGYARQTQVKGKGWQYARPPATRHRDTWFLVEHP